jgi:hypothetical protein
MTEHNGKQYREIQTLEEAEQFLGKVFTCYDGNGQTTEMVYKATEFENGVIKLNKRTTSFLLTNATIDGTLVGIEVEEPEFVLPELDVAEVNFVIKFGMSLVEAQIRKYIVAKGWQDKAGWNGRHSHYAIFYSSNVKQWYWDSFSSVKRNEIYIDTKEHSEWLCEQLNKTGVTE